MVDGSSRALVADVFDFALGTGSPLEMRVWRKRVTPTLTCVNLLGRQVNLRR
jgi:hypothetical protein